jgi:hypothetical protein
MTPQLDYLPASGLRVALTVNTDELPEEEALAIQDFIERIGGRENAMLAVEALEELERGQL